MAKRPGRIPEKHKELLPDQRVVIALDTNALTTHRGKVLENLIKILDQYKDTPAIRIQCLLTTSLMREQTGQYHPHERNSDWNRLIKNYPDSFVVVKEDTDTFRKAEEAFDTYLESKGVRRESLSAEQLDAFYASLRKEGKNFASKDPSQRIHAETALYELEGAGELSVAETLLNGLPADTFKKSSKFNTATTLLYIVSDEKAPAVLKSLVINGLLYGDKDSHVEHTPKGLSFTGRVKLVNNKEAYSKVHSLNEKVSYGLMSPESFLAFAEAIAEEPHKTLANLDLENLVRNGLHDTYRVRDDSGKPYDVRDYHWQQRAKRQAGNKQEGPGSPG